MNEAKLKAIFLLSGIELYACTPKHNPYPGMNNLYGLIWDCWTSIGPMTVGWRKRVIEIQWDTKAANPSKETFTTDGNITFEPGLIHAWSYYEAVEFVGKLGHYHNRTDKIVADGP